MNASELNGALLDYWVARCELNGQLAGHELRRKDNGICLIVDMSDGMVSGYICEGIVGRQRARREWNLVSGEWCYQPSRDWAYAGPIIERERVAIRPAGDTIADWWVAKAPGVGALVLGGPTALVAAMRVVVASHFGMNLPDEMPA